MASYVLQSTNFIFVYTGCRKWIISFEKGLSFLCWCSSDLNCEEKSGKNEQNSLIWADHINHQFFNSFVISLLLYKMILIVRGKKENTCEPNLILCANRIQ